MFRRALCCAFVFAVSLCLPLSASTTKFSAWSSYWTDSTIPLQIGGLDPRQERQAVDIPYNPLNGINKPPVIAFAAAYPGHLYIIGDEVDLYCVAVTIYSDIVADFVTAIRAVDPTARFSASFGGLTAPSCNPLAPYAVAYAQLFYNDYTSRYGAVPISEWRFNVFPDDPSTNPSVIPAYKAWIQNAAAWSVAHGGHMVPTFGFFRVPSGTNVEPYMRDLMNFFNTEPGVGAVAYIPYDDPTASHSLAGNTGNPRTLTYDGMVYDDYTTNLVSPALSGVSQLADFNGDGFADFANFDTATGAFDIHENKKTGGSAAFKPGSWGTGVAAAAGWDVLVGDFNSDGKADYADLHVASGQFWIHLNNGTGSGSLSFSPNNVVSGMARAGADWETLVGDIDGDGDADIVEHNLRDGLLYWKENLGIGTGNFANAGVNIGRTNVGPDWKTVIANFTGPSLSDRRADFADIHVPSAQFWVHENVTFVTGGTSIPVFSSATWGYAAGTSGSNWQLLIGDFTGDGFADFADRSVVSGAFYIHENNADGTFDGPGQDWGEGLSNAGAGWQVFGSK